METTEPRWDGYLSIGRGCRPNVDQIDRVQDILTCLSLIFNN